MMNERQKFVWTPTAWFLVGVMVFGLLGVIVFSSG